MRGHIVKRYKNSYSIVIDFGRDPVTGKHSHCDLEVKPSRGGLS